MAGEIIFRLRDLDVLNPLATCDAYMRQLFHCLHWYAGIKRLIDDIGKDIFWEHIDLFDSDWKKLKQI